MRVCHERQCAAALRSCRLWRMRIGVMGIGVTRTGVTRIGVTRIDSACRSVQGAGPGFVDVFHEQPGAVDRVEFIRLPAKVA